MDDNSFPFIKRYEITNMYDPSDKIPHLQIIQLFPQLFDPSTPSSKSNVKLHPNDQLKEWLELFKEAHKKDKKYVIENVKDQGVKNAYGILEKHEPGDQYKAWKETFGPKVAEQLVQSKAEGINEARMNIAKSLLRSGMKTEDVVIHSGISEEQVRTLSKNVDGKEKSS